MNIREHYVIALPAILEPSAKYYVLDQAIGKFSIFIADLYGNPIPAGYALAQLNEQIASEYGLVGAVDGVNTLFSTASPFVQNSSKLYVNGVRQFLGQDYSESSNTEINLVTPPEIGDNLVLDYIKI